MTHPCVRPCAGPGPRSRLRGAALVTLVLALLLGPLLPGPANAADPDKPSPLSLRLIGMSPAVIPTSGTLVLAGTVTNTSDSVWRAVNVHPFLSSRPMTTREELAAAADSDPASDVGNRLTGPGQFVAVGDVQPAQTLRFRIELPVEDLPIERAPGVFWIGVHALGQGDSGAREVIGRARTFIPLVGAAAAPTSVAVVVPLRQQVRRDAKGRLLDASGWSQELAPSGRLGRLADLLTSAGPAPLTMLVDPAVLEAASSLADGNPPLSLGGARTGTPSSSPSPSQSPSRAGVRTDAADRSTARAWLDGVITAARRHVALGLGYADPDVAALARQDPSLLKRSTELSAESFKTLGIDALPAVAPPTGWLDDAAVARLAKQTTVLVSDHAARRARTRYRAPQGQDLVLTDQQASSGGPAPTAALDALALRQRILADAALRTTERVQGPMVVQLPIGWDPGPGWRSANLFGALKQPWLKLVALGANTDPATPTLDARLGYPNRQRRLEVPFANVGAARELVRTSTALSQLLQSENDVAHDLAGAALDAVSVQARDDAVEARVQVLETNAAIRDRIGKVEVLGTDFVTLSGGSGTLAVTLVNGLDQPVVVGVEPHTSTTDVRIEATGPVRMAPGERTVLRLKAKASSIGVARVLLTPVTDEGTQLGTPLAFSLRTSQVGKTIWFVLIGFGALLVVMVLRRVRRGLVEHRWRGRG